MVLIVLNLRLDMCVCVLEEEVKGKDTMYMELLLQIEPSIEKHVAIPTYCINTVLPFQDTYRYNGKANYCNHP